MVLTSVIPLSWKFHLLAVHFSRCCLTLDMSRGQKGEAEWRETSRRLLQASRLSRKGLEWAGRKGALGEIFRTS